MERQAVLSGSLMRRVARVTCVTDGDVKVETGELFDAVDLGMQIGLCLKGNGAHDR